jgi:hypothetical protein
LLAVALALAWWWEDDAAPASPTPVALPEPLPSPEPLRPTVEPEPKADAGVPILASVDAGTLVLALAVREPDVEDYMRRWRNALAPLFRLSMDAHRPELFRAMVLDAGVPDAGLEPCKPKVQRLAFTPRGRADLVIVVDTSGSMSRTLPKISRWLAELEMAINKAGQDVQLLVVAEQHSLGREVASDGGYDLYVGSRDSLEVLLEGAKPGKNRWTDALRPGVELRIVVVTDDEAEGKGPSYVARLTELLAETRFSVHLLGGLETNGAVLSAEQPLVESTCRADAIIGLERGIAYQEAVRLTGGYRASICSEVARRALSAALLQLSATTAQCAWLLDIPRHRVDRIDAVGPARASTRLLSELHDSSCPGARQSYRLAGSMLALCADTCTSLRESGFDGIELTLECVE